MIIPEVDIKVEDETFSGCRQCGAVYEVMMPERFLNLEKKEETFLFCSIGCWETFKRENQVIEIYPGIYHQPNDEKFITGPSEEIQEKIFSFLDQRFCRENWTSGLSFNNEEELPELLEQFLFWWNDNQ